MAPWAVYQIDAEGFPLGVHGVPKGASNPWGQIKATNVNEQGLPICDPSHQVQKLGAWLLHSKTL